VPTKPSAFLWLRCLRALPLLLTGAVGPSLAQQTSPVGPQQPSKFQARVEAAAAAVGESNPKFKGSSPEYVQGLVEFVSGNMLFVLYHELAHATITQMGLPVPYRREAFQTALPSRRITTRLQSETLRLTGSCTTGS
jgi:hypothetical protein